MFFFFFAADDPDQLGVKFYSDQYCHTVLHSGVISHFTECRLYPHFIGGDDVALSENYYHSVRGMHSIKSDQLSLLQHFPKEMKEASTRRISTDSSSSPLLDVDVDDDYDDDVNMAENTDIPLLFDDVSPPSGDTHDNNDGVSGSDVDDADRFDFAAMEEQHQQQQIPVTAVVEEDNSLPAFDDVSPPS